VIYSCRLTGDQEIMPFRFAGEMVLGATARLTVIAMSVIDFLPDGDPRVIRSIANTLIGFRRRSLSERTEGKTHVFSSELIQR